MMLVHILYDRCYTIVSTTGEKVLAFKERSQLISDLEKARSSFVITYITGTRSGLETSMAMDVIDIFYEHLQNKDSKLKSIDLFIYSNGGDGTVPWKLVTLIREHCDKFSVLVPYRAFSAATLTALGADEIIMHPMGMLGPTDPKVSNEYNPLDNKGNALGINVEDVYSYISLIKEDVGITHEDELVKAWETLAGPSRVHPLALGNVKRFYSQSRMMAKKLLELHMDKVSDEHRVKEIADSLNSKLYFHGHPINRTEAKELGLKVVKPTSKIEKLMWDLYVDYREEMNMRKPFNPSRELKKDGTPLPLLNGPNVSPKSVMVKDNIVAAIESTDISDRFIIDLKIEGYKSIGNNGIQELLQVDAMKEEWSQDKKDKKEKQNA